MMYPAGIVLLDLCIFVDSRGRMVCVGVFGGGCDGVVGLSSLWCGMCLPPDMRYWVNGGFWKLGTGMG